MQQGSKGKLFTAVYTISIETYRRFKGKINGAKKIETKNKSNKGFAKSV
jgi:hypothetical protein